MISKHQTSNMSIVRYYPLFFAVILVVALYHLVKIDIVPFYSSNNIPGHFKAIYESQSQMTQQPLSDDNPPLLEDQPEPIPKFDFPNKITIVTAASSNHYCALKSFLMSLNVMKHNSSGESLFSDALKMPREGLPAPQKPPDWDDASMDDIRIAYGVEPKSNQFHTSQQQSQRRSLTSSFMSDCLDPPTKRDIYGHDHQVLREAIIDPTKPIPKYSIIIYDLGFSADQVKSIKEMQQYGLYDELRRFRYEDYPTFFDVDVNRGEYGWKPTLIKEVWDDMKEKFYPSSTLIKRRTMKKALPLRKQQKLLRKRNVPILLWLDTGDMVTPLFMQQLQDLISKNNGFFSPRSAGTLSTLTHPGIYSALKISDPLSYREIPNCNGALVAFSPAFEAANNLLHDWVSCASVKECIAPTGSSRMNHRQDQSALTIISARDGYRCLQSPNEFGNRIHMDPHCSSLVKAYLNRWEEWFPDLTSGVQFIKNILIKENLHDTEEISYRLWRGKMRLDFKKMLESQMLKNTR